MKSAYQGSCFLSRRRRSQGGSVVVEFAFVFPILFMLIYGTIVYSYVFVVYESLHYAAKTAAESAIRVDPAADGYQGLVQATAQETAQQVLDWIPEPQRDHFRDAAIAKVCPPASGCKCADEEGESDPGTVRVTIVFEPRSPRDLFPVINLPLVGPVPPLPEAMCASASALI